MILAEATTASAGASQTGENSGLSAILLSGHGCGLFHTGRGVNQGLESGCAAYSPARSSFWSSWCAEVRWYHNS